MILDREGWFKRNLATLLAPILGLAIVFSGGLVGYGKLEAEISSYRMEVSRLDVKVAEINAKVDAHHNDSERHMDPQKWDLLMDAVRENKQATQAVESLILRTHRIQQ